MVQLNDQSSPFSANSVSRKGFFLFILLISILVSSFLVVYLEFSIRTLEQRYHSSLESLYLERNQWGVLMLEKGHLESPTRIEKIAKNSLKMHYPNDMKIIYLDTSTIHAKHANSSKSLP